MNMVDSFEKLPVRIYPDLKEGSKFAAKEIAALIQAKKAAGATCVLGLATGSTPRSMYAELVRMHKEEGLSFKNVVTFNLDEYYPIENDALQSYNRFMHVHLFDHIDIDPANIHIPNGEIPKERIKAHCLEYEKMIEEAGGIDLQILGIGNNGHIGFNEPGDDLPVRTHRVRLMESTRRDNAMLFDNDPSRVPAEALSMGIGTILRARRIVLVATGEKKAECIRQATGGRLMTRVPASMLQVHADVELILDREAASLI